MVLIRALARFLILPPALVAPLGLAGEPDATETVVSVLDGVYSAIQAERGEVIYPSICGRCHGYALDGAPDDPDMLPAPPIAGVKFLRKWNGASVAALYEYLRTSMPAINPGSLADSEYLDVLSYMLSVSGMPPGPDDLGSRLEELTGITIELPR